MRVSFIVVQLKVLVKGAVVYRVVLKRVKLGTWLAGQLIWVHAWLVLKFGCRNGQHIRVLRKQKIIGVNDLFGIWDPSSGLQSLCLREVSGQIYIVNRAISGYLVAWVANSILSRSLGRTWDRSIWTFEGHRVDSGYIPIW